MNLIINVDITVKVTAIIILLFRLIVFPRSRQQMRRLVTSFSGFIAIVYLLQLIRREMTDKETVSMCVDNHIVLEPPDADGYVIRPNLPPNQWPFYSGDDESANETDRRIFFHETGGKAQLDIVQCCAVESAAFHNPDRPVRLFIRPPADCKRPRPSISNQPCSKVFNHYSNIDAVLVNEHHYVAGSPLEEWYRKGEWRHSRYDKVHLSDYFRMLTMSKGGGLYLDLDTITLQSFNGDMFRNFVIYGGNGSAYIPNAVMHLERGHWLTEEILQMLAEEYVPGDYLFHGPEVLTAAMNKFCGISSNQVKTLKDCRNTIHVLSERRFIPFPFDSAAQLFEDHKEKTPIVLKSLEKSFGLHVWNFFMNSYANFFVNISSNQLIAVVFRHHCPVTSSITNFQIQYT